MNYARNHAKKEHKILVVVSPDPVERQASVESPGSTAWLCPHPFRCSKNHIE